MRARRHEPPRRAPAPATPGRKAPAPPPAPLYTPPPGLPADPTQLLALLQSGSVPPAAATYLHNPSALAQYEAAIAAARALNVDPAAVHLAEQIAAAWRAWRIANPAPPARDPFRGLP